MRKRQKLVLVALMLGVIMAFGLVTRIEMRYWWVLGLTVSTWIFTAWALREGLVGYEWLTIPLPGTLFSAGAGLFSMLLPSTWWGNVLYIGVFSMAHYFLLLTQNIFSVAAIRTIALYRAASAVGFVMTIATAFLLYNTILSFKQSLWVNALGVGVISLLLLFPVLWTIKLEPKIGRNVWVNSVVLSLFTGFFALCISFWPIATMVGSIFLSTVMYVYLGIVSHHMEDRLYKKAVWEYLSFGTVVLVTMLLTVGR